MGWRAHLQGVRAAAVRLADAGRLVIYRKGKPVDPHDFRGVYRLGAPNSRVTGRAHGPGNQSSIRPLAR